MPRSFLACQFSWLHPNEDAPGGYLPPALSLTKTALPPLCFTPWCRILHPYQLHTCPQLQHKLTVLLMTRIHTHIVGVFPQWCSILMPLRVVPHCIWNLVHFFSRHRSKMWLVCLQTLFPFYRSQSTKPVFFPRLADTASPCTCITSFWSQNTEFYICLCQSIVLVYSLWLLILSSSLFFMLLNLMLPKTVTGFPSIPLWSPLFHSKTGRQKQDRSAKNPLPYFSKPLPDWC